MGLVDVVKKAAIDAVAASNPVAVVFGEVISVMPIAIRVDQRFTLTHEFLILTAAIQALKVTVGATEYVVREGLKASDKVLLLRMQGGQQYVVMDKVVSS